MSDFNPNFAKCPYCGKALEGAESNVEVSGRKMEKQMEGRNVSFHCKRCSVTIIATVFRHKK